MNFLNKNWIKIIGVFILLLLLFWLFFIKFNQKVTAPNNENLNINTNENLLSTTTVVDTSVTQKTMPIVKIETNKGDITIELYASDAPKTVENFLTLVNKGFYDNVIFHRVISGFMIQGGDPTGTGRGGPGYQFADELDPKNASYQAGYVRGTVAMANSGPNTNGSQFFIMHQDYPLDHNYTIFGRVVSGLEVVDAIATSKTDATDRPLEEIKIKKAEVIE
ncbi:MAG: peptidylprolyl isomerase [Patescibacteria group bacterium]|jgi:cyclophilin family peptidyl-prolyl cis-trans isomerase